MKHLVLCAALATAATPALADSYVPIKDQATFLSLVNGKELRNRLYGVRVSVFDNGAIQGAALGWGITGSWSWQDGYFCREMNWGGDPIPYNCQLVEARGDQQVRFTVDRGNGQSASFRIQ
ncbi:dihydrodipicolinate reductase [Cognatiyoonia sp. IB215446]|uniref:dihydrodipicolinate reductase n=1 Tax=Cognatiyoonia sp. IB215446 TaxID=3097355 RepID=UPI002A107E00|nr:dihydrodipicolinate reductase [Cognatiyoonia sp. IB215446]MDX8350343.1 dihydrodipicolinate reductase [Cognatiyoonia sp. IB215446]